MKLLKAYLAIIAPLMRCYAASPLPRLVFRLAFGMGGLTERRLKILARLNPCFYFGGRGAVTSGVYVDLSASLILFDRSGMLVNEDRNGKGMLMIDLASRECQTVSVAKLQQNCIYTCSGSRAHYFAVPDGVQFLSYRVPG